MLSATPTDYAFETLEYLKRAKLMREGGATFGRASHKEALAAGGYSDPLSEAIAIYDVDKRKYAGFNKALSLLIHGQGSPFYPYAVGPLASAEISREGAYRTMNFEALLYAFIVHRATGSGISYHTRHNGYVNALVCKFVERGFRHTLSEYMSIASDAFREGAKVCSTGGYIIPKFGGRSRHPTPMQHYVSADAPRIAVSLARWLEGKSTPPTYMEVIDRLNSYNRSHGLESFHFVYAAVAADIADFAPGYIDIWSLFPAGSNAKRCLKLQFAPGTKWEDAVAWFMERTGLTGPDIEDCGACDVIRWLENYLPIREGNDYWHLDFDGIFSKPVYIHDHPYGRQKSMLDLGLIPTFNLHKVPHRRNEVLKHAGISEAEYRARALDLKNRAKIGPCPAP